MEKRLKNQKQKSLRSKKRRRIFRKIEHTEVKYDYVHIFEKDRFMVQKSEVDGLIHRIVPKTLQATM